MLADCGRAPELTGIVDWLNTPGDAPLSLAGLQAEGRVVLVDFWTYSCINCQRTLPYITAWDAAYRDQGLTVIGVHSPEFALRARRGQRRRAVRRTSASSTRSRSTTTSGPGAPTTSATGRRTT